MKIYSKPWYYTATHVAIGILIAWYPLIAIPAIAYQLAQLAFNVRVFPVEWKILPGNSVEYTGLKLLEIGAGYILGVTVKQGVENF